MLTVPINDSIIRGLETCTDLDGYEYLDGNTGLTRYRGIIKLAGEEYQISAEKKVKTRSGTMPFYDVFVKHPDKPVEKSFSFRMSADEHCVIRVDEVTRDIWVHGVDRVCRVWVNPCVEIYYRRND